MAVALQGGRVRGDKIETVAEGAAAADHVEALYEPWARRLQISRSAARALAAGGRLGVVWLPSFAVVSRHVAPLGTALVLTTLVSAIWCLALRSAFADGRLTIYALGAWIPAAVGTALGLAWVIVLNAVVPEMRLPVLSVFELAVVLFLLFLAWESIAYYSLAELQRVLIVGTAAGGSELVDDLARAGSLPFELIGIVDDELEASQIAGAPVHGRIADVAAIVEAQRPDLVVLASGGRSRSEAFGRLLDVAGSGFKVVGLPGFYEHAFGRVPVQHLTPEWFMAVMHLYRRPYTKAAKRTFDVTAAAFGLLLVAPLLPVLALLVRRTPGPIIFRQLRLGEGGRPFVMLKFRTMRKGAEAPGRAIWAAPRDPRVTGPGRVMRRTRLDELPQLWNVMRGDMSIVGPRPERPEFVADVERTVPLWTRRHLVKPGVTGWAQLRRGYTDDSAGTAEKLSYDLWYLRHRSLTVDLAICAKTLTTLLTGSGAR